MIESREFCMLIERHAAEAEALLSPTPRFSPPQRDEARSDTGI